jgi:hypothetical protein
MEKTVHPMTNAEQFFKLFQETSSFFFEGNFYRIDHPKNRVYRIDTNQVVVLLGTDSNGWFGYHQLPYLVSCPLFIFAYAQCANDYVSLEELFSLAYPEEGKPPTKAMLDRLNYCKLGYISEGTNFFITTNRFSEEMLLIEDNVSWIAA